MNDKTPFYVFAFLNFGRIIGAQGVYHDYYFFKIFWIVISVVSLILMIYLFAKCKKKDITDL